MLKCPPQTLEYAFLVQASLWPRQARSLWLSAEWAPSQAALCFLTQFPGHQPLQTSRQVPVGRSEPCRTPLLAWEHLPLLEDQHRCHLPASLPDLAGDNQCSHSWFQMTLCFMPASPPLHGGADLACSSAPALRMHSNHRALLIFLPLPPADFLGSLGFCVLRRQQHRKSKTVQKLN